jgi:hypothetical protein
MSILDDFYAAYDNVRNIAHPELWYIINEYIAPGKMLQVKASELFPEVWHVHPDDWSRFHREMTAAGFQLKDFHGWLPPGAPKPKTIDQEK